MLLCSAVCYTDRMDKNFDFKKHEQLINAKWLDDNMFRAEVDHNKKPFTIIMPPPNITSRLHIGHAFGFTIKDILARYKRMQGFNVLQLPGADHAAIATEVKVTEELRKQGIEKSSLTQQEFLVHVHKWYEIYTAEIVGQMKKLGLSCDWSRFSFTMDDRTTLALKTVFENLHKKGLIYKGERMINWCPTCQTALSDAEVEHESKSQPLYQITFPFEQGGKDGVTIATVRPEVVFGDAAIAVNPADKRYTKIVGKSVFIPLTDIQIPIIADKGVDMKFGTGCLQITPLHSHTDFELAQKHGLPMPSVTLEPRKEVVKKLKHAGYIVGEKNHTSNVGCCYRCHKAVEPTTSNQWFMRMDGLAKSAIAALNNGLTIVPKKFEKVYLHWLNNIRDWCISRQLRSGHKIPIDGETDMLDTWFSSALWAFCTLGWPEQTEEMKYFYPSDVMVMGYDILFFWAVRMVFSGIEHTGKIPFHTLLLTGLVRDSQGRKMSKSLGNGIDPLDVIDQFGTDALRFSLIAGTKLDRDPRYGLDRATLARNFINKIWNATKFYLAQIEISRQLDSLPQSPSKEQPNPPMNTLHFGDKKENQLARNLSTADKWILTKLNSVIKSTTRKYEKFDFGVAANDLQSFFWYDFCDWYLEESKKATNRETALAVFHHVLTQFLKLINPVMPFVTEHIYCDVLGLAKTMLREPWAVAGKSYPREKKEFDKHIEEVKTQRAAAIEKADSLAAGSKTAAQIKHLEKEIQRSEQMLSNENFVARAPKNLVDTEREKLAENRATLKKLREGA